MHASELLSLKDRVAVITGSTRGIGLATARLMASAGARVTVSSRKAEACEAVAAQLRGEGHGVMAVPCHVARDEDRQRLIETTLQTWGRIDVLVANAAVNPSFAPLHDLPEDSWNKVLDTNLTGSWKLCRSVYPSMAAQGGGAIVLLSSIAGVLGVPNSGAYAISKAAGNHLARQLAVEWGPSNIRVNVVAPGTTRTDMIRALMARPGAYEAAVQQTALRRIGEAQDVAAAILFLASDAARQITGQVLTVDGGETLRAQA